ncbi:hypothetical protein EJ05DRAFT_473005, partial [Pseudovirgaria hyperparasitica]
MVIALLCWRIISDVNQQSPNGLRTSYRIVQVMEVWPFPKYRSVRSTNLFRVQFNM